MERRSVARRNEASETHPQPHLQGDTLRPCAFRRRSRFVLRTASVRSRSHRLYFFAYTASQPNCAVPQTVQKAQNLAASDPVHVQIGTGPASGTVTCLDATAGPVTITSGTQSAQLTCR